MLFFNMDFCIFFNEMALESVVLGGGLVVAYVGVLGVFLGMMVVNLFFYCWVWDDCWVEFFEWVECGQCIKDGLLVLVDEDICFFNGIIVVVCLFKGMEVEKVVCYEVMQEAIKYVIEVFFCIMELVLEIFEVCKVMVEKGNFNFVSDVGVGVLCVWVVVYGVWFNVCINVGDIEDKAWVEVKLLVV